ncbi:hypothetical protein RHECNPAF_470064 [Rhizobium etli CNPAF512]|nr:hypothetical protein RHECNPAF_470064 [Rhizobium etli CNPAF512]
MPATCQKKKKSHATSCHSHIQHSLKGGFSEPWILAAGLWRRL